VNRLPRSLSFYDRELPLHEPLLFLVPFGGGIQVVGFGSGGDGVAGRKDSAALCCLAEQGRPREQGDYVDAPCLDGLPTAFLAID